MNTAELRTDLHNLIDKVEDPIILNAIRTILSKELHTQDFWDDLPLDVRKSVERGIEQAQVGETTAHYEVMKQYNKWL